MKVAVTFNAHMDEVCQIVIAKDFLYSASYDGTVRKWDISLLKNGMKPIEKLKPNDDKKQNTVTEDEDKELEDLMNELEE